MGTKIHKGRVAVLGGMIAFATATVLVGSSGADSVKVGDATNSANQPHQATGCVTLQGVPASNQVAEFTLIDPTPGPSFERSPVNGQYDVASGIPSDVTPAAQGYHVRVVVDGSQKVFWVAQGSAGCLSFG